MTQYKEQLQAVLGFAVPVTIFGVVYGALCRELDTDVILATCGSALIFAGGSQFAAIAVLAGGGTTFAAASAGLILNMRYLPLSLSLAERLQLGRALRVAAAHLLIDESALLALQESDPVRAKWVYWVCGCVLFCAWTGGTALGAALGATVDVQAWGIDAAMPAGMLALLAPALRAPRTRRAAIWGALIAVVGCDLPPGWPLLLAAATLPLAIGVHTRLGWRRIPRRAA